MIEVAHTGTPILYLGFSLLVVVFLALSIAASLLRPPAGARKGGEVL